MVRAAARRAENKRRYLTARGLHAAAGVHHRIPGPGVAFTFDDGPDPIYTPQVLDVLRDLNAVATFFVVGASAAAHPQLIRRMIDEGHAIGSHTTSHTDLWTLTTAQVHEEVRSGHQTLEEVAGRRTDLFRPPKGHVDLRVVRAARRCGLRPWLWTIDPTDWAPETTADDITAAVRPGAGDVVLLHDGMYGAVAPSAVDRSQTVAALPALVEDIRGRGLDLVTIPEGQVRR